MESGIYLSLHPNRKYQQTYANFNLKIYYYPSPNERKILYKEARVIPIQ